MSLLNNSWPKEPQDHGPDGVMLCVGAHPRPPWFWPRVVSWVKSYIWHPDIDSNSLETVEVEWSEPEDPTSWGTHGDG